MSFENKKKFALWVHPETLEKVEQVYREDNCQSKSEFIEKAVDFYYGFLTSDNYKTFLPNVVTSTLKSIVAESDNRQNRMLFKLAVEIAILENPVSYTHLMEPAGFRNYGRCRPALHSDPCGAASDAPRSRHTLLWFSDDPHG